MVEKVIPNRQTQVIEKQGKYGATTKGEHIKKLKIDKLVYRNSQAKTFRGYLVGCIKIANADKNKELEILMEAILTKYNEFEE